MDKKIKKILDDLPHAPGVYKMKDKEGKVIYIGKAKDLAKRVRQYFRHNYEHSTRTKKLVENIANIEIVTVDTELESMILETNLIKQFKPKYNILMKDDKNYVYIKITNEDFPRIRIVRQVEKDGAKYFGPKPAAHKVKATFKILKKIFPFRHCNLDIEYVGESSEEDVVCEVNVTHKTIKYPCLDFFIKRCAAPCIGKVSKDEYMAIIKNVENFLEGRADEIMKNLRQEMMDFAENRKFEMAAKWRDKIAKVEDILEKQNVADPSQKSQDVINYCVTHEQAYINLFQVRDGKLIGQENFILNAREVEENSVDGEVLEAYLNQYYEIATDVPREVLLPHRIEGQKLFQDYLKEESGHAVKIVIPKLGGKHKILEMSLNNARIFADRNKPKWYEESKLTVAAALELQKILGIENPLKRIECYDISHLSGTDTVGSMVVFENGAPKNAMYRKFKIRTVEDGKPDDFKSMAEVLRRRLTKIGEVIDQEDFKFKRARKIDAEVIKKELDADDFEHFYIQEKQEKDKKKNHAAVLARLTEFSNKVALISGLWVSPDYRGRKLGHKMMKDLIKKTSSKRIYVICREELREYYLLMGFEEIKKLPVELEKKMAECKKVRKDCMVLAFDKIKHKPDPSFTKVPDLIVIDGGKGQLSAVTEVIEDLGLKIPYVSLAKRLEEIFVPGDPVPILLPEHNEALKLLQKARDEAHRFAISFNKDLRSKKFKRK